MRSAALLLSALALAGCESTQAKSARLAKSAKSARVEHGVSVAKLNPDVRVLSTALVQDANGAAAVVELRSGARSPQADLPLALVVRDAAGKTAYANDAPGLDRTLTHVPLLLPGQRAFWVDDQVSADKPHDVQAKVGTSATAVPGQLPQLVATGLALDDEPSGAFTSGTLRNDSGVEQRGLIVYAVAERAGRVVAAGRAGIQRLKAHASATFKVFWIGDPKRASVRVFAPPTVLKEGAK
jgi:hypothetical protein